LGVDGRDRPGRCIARRVVSQRQGVLVLLPLSDVFPVTVEGILLCTWFAV